MRIGWEDFGESVTHLELAIERAVEECLVRVQRSVALGMACNGRVRVVLIAGREAALIVLRLDRQRGEISLFTVHLRIASAEEHGLCLLVAALVVG